MIEALEARMRLDRIAEEIRQRAGEGDVDGLEELMRSYALFLPLLINLHLTDLALLQSLGAFHEWWPEEGHDEGGAGEGGGLVES